MSIYKVGFILIGFMGLVGGVKSQPEVETSVTVEVSHDPAVNYQTFCGGCHGVKLEAFVDQRWKYGKEKEDLIKGIEVGYEDDGMPAFDVTFSDQEVENLADYILNGIQHVEQFHFQKQPSQEELTVSEDQPFRLEKIVDGLTIPWGIEFLPDGSLLIAEKSGELIHWKNDQKIILEGTPMVRDQSQGGLMDLELHPNYAENGWLYYSFSKFQPGSKNESTTAIHRAKIEGNKLVQIEELFVALPYSSRAHHYGSRLEFDEHGYLYFTVGDRGNRDQNPQNLDNHCGKVHRILDDGSIPSDNPFVKEAPEFATIYSYGHRNPQGLALHPETGEIWDNEHGPRGGDEINRIIKGKNYGWPIISYGINYNGTTFTNETHKPGMLQPDHYWVPAIGVCGMTFVKGDKYPGWNGDILSGSLKYQYLHRTKMNGNQVIGQELLLKKIGRLRVVEMGNDGYIYVGVESPTGSIYRLVPE